MIKTDKINGFRFVFSIIVLIHHFMMAFYPKSKIFFYNDGNYAVLFFLIVCGFVTPLKIFTNHNLGHGNKITAIGIYIRRRYFRLLPIVAITIIASWIIYKLRLYYTQEFCEVYQLGTLDKYVIENVSAIRMLYSALLESFISRPILNTPFWTIKYEFFGAICCYAMPLFLMKYKSRIIWYLVIGVVICILLRDYYWICPILGLVISDILFSTNKKIKHWRTKIKGNRCYFFLIVSILLYILSMNLKQFGIIGNFNVALQISFRIGSALSLVLFLLLDNKGNLVLERLKVCSKISFEIYGIHWIVICSLGCYMMTHPLLNTYKENCILSFIAVLISTIVLSIGLHLIIRNIPRKSGKTKL